MSHPFVHDVLAVVVSLVVIYALRAAPFVLFSRKASAGSPLLAAIERWISPVAIAALAVYSYAGLEWRTASPYVAGAVVVVLQLLFRQGLLSILAGTALYMALIRL